MSRELIVAGVAPWLMLALGCPSASTAPTDAGSREDAGSSVDAHTVDAPPIDAFTRTGPRGECTIPPEPAPPSAGCPPLAERELVAVEEDVVVDTRWTCDRRYRLRATRAIFVRDGATLTVEPGVVVESEVLEGSTLSFGPLVIATSGRIDARGTASDPIVFTSALRLGEAHGSSSGGVVLLGRAPINAPLPTNAIEGLDPAHGGYGGDDPTHDCGTLRHVRIEYGGAGYLDSELAGLTVAGCGSETELAFIQSHGSGDDGVAVFGGTASFSHILVSQPDDDGFDWDEGWRGSAQFLIVQQGDRSDRAIEADNLGSDQDASPRSAPTLWNLTLVGSHEYNDGARLREGTAGHIANALFTGYPRESTCVRVDNSSTIRQANEGALRVHDSVFEGCGTPLSFTPDEGDDATVFTGDWRSPNHFDVEPLLEDPHDLGAPSFVPDGDSELGWRGGWPDEGFDRRADFVGAIEPGCWDWTDGWTHFPAAAD